jgi:hypothetical protein
MADFFIKQNDTSPVFQATLKGPSGSAQDLTGCTITFKMANSVSEVKVNQPVTSVDDASNGIVTYEWAAEDTNTSGTFFAEFEVIKADGKKETFPNTVPINVVIKKDVV